MKARDFIFPVGALVVLVFLYYLSTTGRKPPMIPSDAVHAAIADQRACLACHGPDKAQALKRDHPPKEMCFECHKRQGGTK